MKVQDLSETVSWSKDGKLGSRGAQPSELCDLLHR